MIKFILVMFLFFLLLVFLLGFSLIRSVKNIFFGGGNKSSNTQQRRTQPNPEQRHSKQQQRPADNPYPQAKKKIIEKDEGEYVDYEEVKE